MRKHTKNERLFSNAKRKGQQILEKRASPPMRAGERGYKFQSLRVHELDFPIKNVKEMKNEK